MDTTINHIIARVLSGEVILDDIALLGGWINESEANKREFELLKVYWEAEIKAHNASSPDMILEKIRQNIHQHEIKRERMQLWLVYIPAAVIVLGLILTTFSLLYSRDSAMDSPQEVKEYYTYLTNENRSSFTLSDGTRITLNKNSWLTFTDDFGKDNRYVKLNGEAFFEVTHNPESPFEVALEIETQKDASIKVLGTTFDVKIDADSKRIVATLVKGSIRFQTPGKQVLLEPNQQLEFRYDDKQINIQTVDAEGKVAWKDGILKYKNISFSSLIEDLGERFDTEIVISNEKLKDPFITVSGAFDESQSLDDIIRVVSRSLPIKWSEKGGKYYIK